MRHERTEGRDREVQNEPAVRGSAAQEDEGKRHVTDPEDNNDDTTTRRGSSSERSER